MTAILSGCSDICSNKMFNAVWNNDHSYQMAVFERNCGATTGFSYHVAIIRDGEGVLETGNASIVDGDHGAVRDPTPQVRWINNSEALIELPKGVRVFQKADRIGDVSIKYQQQ